MTPQQSRPCLVLIAGTLCDARLFARQTRALRHVARVIVLNYACAKATPSGTLELLRTLPERFSVAGFSLGGLWALALLRAAPERLERLALIASNAEAATAGIQRRNHNFWRLWTARGPAAVARKVKPRYFHHEATRTKHAALVRDMASGTQTHAARAQFALAASRPSSLEVLSKFTRPLLIVSGANDTLCPRAWQARMAKAQPLAVWHELPRCGHLIPLEAAVPLSALLLRWMAVPASPRANDAKPGRDDSAASLLTATSPHFGDSLC